MMLWLRSGWSHEYWARRRTRSLWYCHLGDDWSGTCSYFGAHVGLGSRGLGRSLRDNLYPGFPTGVYCFFLAGLFLKSLFGLPACLASLFLRGARNFCWGCLDSLNDRGRYRAVPLLWTICVFGSGCLYILKGWKGR